MSFNKLYKARHILVIGATGSGKTYFASRYAEKLTGIVLIINPEEDSQLTSVCDVQIDSADDFTEALEAGYKKIDFIPPEDNDVAIEHIDKMREILFAIGDNRTKKNKWCYIIIDEAQLYAPKSRKSPVENIFKRGRKRGIQGIALTQRPASLSHDIITQTELQVIFRFNPYEMTYFDHYKIPVRDYEDWLNKEYHYITIDAFGRIEKHEPV